MTSFLIVFWLFSAYIIGRIGKNRTIGFWGALIATLIGGPIIGLIITLISKKKDINPEYEEALKEYSNSNDNLLDTEMKKLRDLHHQGVINYTEFEEARKRLIETLGAK